MKKQTLFLILVLGLTVSSVLIRNKPIPRVINDKLNRISSMEVINKDSILSELDNSLESPFSDFINFDAAYSEYVNGRLKLFRSNKKWALVFEKLGFNFRAGDPVQYEIYYFGNCIENLDVENNFVSNYKIFPIENDIYESIKGKRDTISFKGQKIKIPLDKHEYIKLKIPLEYGSNDLYEGAVLRYLVEKNKSVLFAEDELIYSCLPKEIKEVLVIDEWYHQNYQQYDQKVKPSKQIFYRNVAEILSEGDINKFSKPKKCNTHWSNWLDSGSY